MVPILWFSDVEVLNLWTLSWISFDPKTFLVRRTKFKVCELWIQGWYELSKNEPYKAHWLIVVLYKEPRN